jgi:hypothetical protein
MRGSLILQRHIVKAATGATPLFSSWFALANNAAQLGFEAQNVMALRLMRLAAGGTAGQEEASRMISEKYSALAEAQMIAAMGVSAGRSSEVVAGTILRSYGKHVRANQRRLIGR